MLTLGSLIAGTAWAGNGLSASLFAFPGYEVQWHKGEGVPDGTKSQQALHLEKVDRLADTNGSGVIISSVEGITLTELGFDRRKDGVCGPFPRYKVTTTDGNVYFFRCHGGMHADSLEDPTNWTRIRFSSADAEPESLGQPPFVFGVTQLQTLGLSFRLDVGMAGFTHLDNLDINGTLIGKPGSNRYREWSK